MNQSKIKIQAHFFLTYGLSQCNSILNGEELKVVNEKGYSRMNFNRMTQSSLIECNGIILCVKMCKWRLVSLNKST